MFVDLHNHILPGIDDGAEDLIEALRMAKLAVADGTDTLVATPHRRWPRRDDANPIWVREHVSQLQAVLDAENIPLRLVAGVEIPMSRTLAEDLQEGKIGTMGGGQWALIEPPFERIPPEALDILQSVRTAGYEIVLAHPERNAEVQRDLTFLEACAGLGIVFQLTSGSLTGRFGPLAQRTAEKILAHAEQWPLVIASDTHDLEVRSPNLMAAARDAAAKIVGLEQAQAMVDSRPRSFIPTA